MESYSGLGADDALDRLIAECGASGRTTKDTLSVAWNFQRNRARQRRLADEADDHFLAKYRDDETASIVPE
eukprot:1621241-Pyramimonas_sp.AAC.1